MSKHPLILAIETSCDETAVAVAEGTAGILVSEVASQIELHSPYGGVVPELASRNHNITLRPLIETALSKSGLSIEDLDAIAATSGPGLASSLLIGDTTAKAIAVASGKPFYSINHMEGHMLSPFIENETGVLPNISLVVSGGHTMLVKVDRVGGYKILGATLDDAAGEAFDKAGKMMGLPYPGGPEIDRLSANGDPDAFDFPRAMLKSGDFQFSFSGMKTAMSHRIAGLGNKWDSNNEKLVSDLCASFQAAILDVLIGKTIAAVRETGASLVTVSGGVSCNRGLREQMTDACAAAGVKLQLATPSHSTDNAAMIAYAAACRFEAGLPASGFDQDINPNLQLL
ncbi:MAG: tRNA (adenosine(37)-N6)-threonylcarbamoyltransferase complex transferase subunit TsaD [Verrucomicrobiales bacterium]|nr:tRNA (adenosine(37)-N6)-threonylcarbamoyltransferase complex transferase subunit TsaD [Verrucomicrobiales bacterium]